MSKPQGTKPRNQVLRPAEIEAARELVRNDDSRLYRRFWDRYRAQLPDLDSVPPVAPAAEATAPDLEHTRPACATAASNPNRHDQAPPTPRVAVEDTVPPRRRATLPEAAARRKPATIVRFAGERARIGASLCLIVDQYEWLQLTLGRFLAPIVDHGDGNTTAYLVPAGDPGGSADLELEGELRAFEATLDRLRTHLEGLLELDHRASDVLASLHALLELRLPAAGEHDGVHLRDGQLWFAGWGLVSGERLGNLLDADPNSGTRAAYVTSLRARFGLTPTEGTDPDDPRDVPDAGVPETPTQRKPVRLDTARTTSSSASFGASSSSDTRSDVQTPTHSWWKSRLGLSIAVLVIVALALVVLWQSQMWPWGSS